MTAEIPRVMLVAAHSGAGKTTLTCAVLQALKNRGADVMSFKCGPDYIDPMFHSKVIGAKSRNLDIYMCGERVVRYLFAENARTADFAVIEGVMGMYDGVSTTDYGSSNHLAKLTDTPEILVVNTKGKGLSLLAEISGFLNFKPNNLKGVICNQTTESSYAYYKQLIEDGLGLKVYGYMPPVPSAEIKSRHLGLITADEISDIREKLNALAEACEKSVDIDGLLKLGNEAARVAYDEINVEKCAEGVRIAVAMDKAFCFYYEDNFALLEKLGAELVYFSPLNGENVPENCHGLLFGGGYPEEYADTLSKNEQTRESVKRAVESGIPCLAECGGFMYLCDGIGLKDGKSYEMAGVFNTKAYMTDKLSRFGYIKLTALKDNLLCEKGGQINAHEFHYSDAENCGDSFEASKTSGKTYQCVHAGETVFAGYPHLHLWGSISFAENFVKACAKVKAGKPQE